MGKPVTVDSDDLEALLFGAAAVKQIEVALKQTREDPFLGRVKGKLTEAHDNIARAWRDATRVNEDPRMDEPLSAGAEAAIRHIGPNCAVAQGDIDAKVLVELRAKMMVELGHLYTISCAQWGNTQEEQRKVAAEQLVVRLTARGREIYNNPRAIAGGETLKLQAKAG